MGNFQVDMGCVYIAIGSFQVYMSNCQVAMGNCQVAMGNCQFAMGNFKNQCTVHDIGDVIVSVFSLHVIDCWFKQKLPTVADKTKNNNIDACCSSA
jgi:hypothetical protein